MKLDIPKTKEEVALITAPVLNQLRGLEVTDAKSYAVADSWLTRIKEARDTVKARLDRVLVPAQEAYKAAKKTWDEAKALHEEMDIPLYNADFHVRNLMKGYKQAELRERLEADAKRREDEEKIQAEINAKQLKEQAAKTKAMRERLAAQRLELEAKRIEVTATPTTAPVKVAGSTTRTVKRWKVVDEPAFIREVIKRASEAKGIEFAMSTLTIDIKSIDVFFRQDPGMVAGWPGIEVYDDVQIVRRG